MIYLKSVLAGLTTLIVVVILYATISIVPVLLKIWRERDEGSVGSVTFNFHPFYPWLTLTVALLVFAAGFYWQYRRARKQLHKA